MNDVWMSPLQVRSEIVYPLGLIIAICITLHVLLRKREIATAAAWIGLAWFAPISGHLPAVWREPRPSSRPPGPPRHEGRGRAG